LLDSCAARNTPMAGAHGAKQVIAAYSPDEVSLVPGARSFTASLAETLNRLSTGQPFGAQRLHEEVVALRHQEALARVPNGPTKPPVPRERTPVFYTLTPAKGHGIILAPMEPKRADLRSPPDSARTETQQRPFSPDEVSELVFDEPRVLVCTTFVGEASPDMASFNHWLQRRPLSAAKVSVEGIFLGPPTMLLISMPHSIWNVVQHDKVCCFLGHINSNNMVHLYQRLVKSAPEGIAPPSAPLLNLANNANRDIPASTAAAPPPPLTPEAPRREEHVFPPACSKRRCTKPDKSCSGGGGCAEKRSGRLGRG